MDVTQPTTSRPAAAEESVPETVSHITAAKSQFNVYDRAVLCNQRISYSRRDFYKIALMRGSGRLNYANRGILIDQPALLFSNPLVPYSFDPLPGEHTGYFCLFTDEFLQSDRSVSLQESPLFKLSSDPVYFLSEAQFATLAHIFQEMLQEMESGYQHKQDLMRTYVTLLLHQALKMQPHTTYYHHPNAASRIAALFQELLERQFPIDAPDHGLKLRTPGDFARHLSVHVNHLNRAVKEITGKPTSAHIAERLVGEAKALLQHTTWSTAEIAYGLGFESPNYFNNFFKKHTDTTPTAVRAALYSEVSSSAGLVLANA